MDLGSMEAGAGDAAEMESPVRDIDAGEPGTFAEYIAENVAYLRDLEVFFSFFEKKIFFFFFLWFFLS